MATPAHVTSLSLSLSLPLPGAHGAHVGSMARPVAAATGRWPAARGHADACARRRATPAEDAGPVRRRRPTSCSTNGHGHAFCRRSARCGVCCRCAVLWRVRAKVLGRTGMRTGMATAHPTAHTTAIHSSPHGSHPPRARAVQRLPRVTAHDATINKIAHCSAARLLRRPLPSSAVRCRPLPSSAAFCCLLLPSAAFWATAWAVICRHRRRRLACRLA